MALADAVPFAVGHWPLDEASGSALETINSYDGTETGGTIETGTGKFDGARDFENADTEHFSIADNADLSGGDVDFMIRVWVNAEAFGGFRGILGKDSGGGVLRDYGLYYDSTANRFRFNVWSPDGVNNVVSADNFGAPSTATWYLIHAWHDSVNNEIGIAVNAGTANTAAYSSGVRDSTTDFRIGQTQNLYWDGLIDDVVFLRGYILDATERTADYNSGTGVAFAEWGAGGGGRTTKNTRSFPLGIHVGMGFSVSG